MVKFNDELLNSGKSPTTINKYLQKLSLLFVWLSNHHEGIVNHFAGLKLQRVKEVNARSGYTSAEKQLLIQWAKEQQPYRKWIALLGLYTGARANEICQLYADDVQQVDEVWCLNIRDNRPDQSKRPAKAVLTGETGYSAGRATRQGSSSLTRFTGQSAITFSTCRR